MNEPLHEDDLLLDRAIALLRDEPVPPLPPLTQPRTRAAIQSATGRSQMGFARAFRIAAMLLIGLAAISLTAFIISRHQHDVAVGPHSPAVTPKTPTEVGPSPAPIPHPSPAPGVPKPESVFASNVSITGRVFFHGTLAPRKSIDLRGCPQCLELTHGTLLDDSLVVNPDGTLQNVVVSISAGLPPGEQYPAPAEPVLLDQRGCMFRPHVIAAMVGQNVVVKNSDPLLHTVHSTESEQAPAFNFAQPATGQRVVNPLEVVETFSIKCDLHPWMNAWMRIFNHPYFDVTRDDGRFQIRDLPPGTYRIKAWHERLGVREMQVTIRSGQPAQIDFTFDAK